MRGAHANRVPINRLRPYKSNFGGDAIGASLESRLAAFNLAPTGAFCSVPDVNEFEKLNARVLALEAEAGTATSGYRSTDKTLQSLLAQSTDYANRLASMELTVTRLLAENKSMLNKLENYTRSDLRFGTLIENLSRKVTGLDDRIRRHEQNDDMHDYDDNHHRPKGFQPNDQPRVFMGTR